MAPKWKQACDLLTFSLTLSLASGRGCVSGAQIGNMRDKILKDGSYECDMIDGFDELE